MRKLADYCIRYLGPHLECNATSEASHAEESGDTRRSRARHAMAGARDRGAGSNEKGEEAQGDDGWSTDGVNARDKYVELLVAIVQVSVMKQPSREVVREVLAVGRGR